MKQIVYDPSKSGKKMNIVCFVSGSGTNYREISARGPEHNYVVFTNRPGCAAVDIAKHNKHPVVELSNISYLKTARTKYGSGNVPRNAHERQKFEQDAMKQIENKLGKEPDLICLAGYDQWVTDWLVDKYYPKILNIHPGDTTRGYDGLYWIPTAKAILAGDKDIRSTLFFIDKGEDTGPVLMQSAPLDIEAHTFEVNLNERFLAVKRFAADKNIYTYDEFEKQATPDIKEAMKHVCEHLQVALKVAGDWKIYPFAVHDLIARGRVEVEGRSVYVDGKKLPGNGYRMG